MLYRLGWGLSVSSWGIGCCTTAPPKHGAAYIPRHLSSCETWQGIREVADVSMLHSVSSASSSQQVVIHGEVLMKGGAQVTMHVPWVCVRSTECHPLSTAVGCLV
jgi:hypothetical protein